MLRIPKAGPPSAPARGAPSLVPPQSQKKSMAVGGSAELVVAELAAGPAVRALPAAYFAQVYPQAAVVAPLPRGGCLYATPHGPEIKTMRSASTGKLPAKRKLDLEGTAHQRIPEFRTPKGKGTALPHIPSPKTPKSPAEKTRYDTSLGLLTKKFIHLLSESEDGVLDLNRAAEVLEVQKRRIYDITNVLEGIQLIRKKSKNNIQWMGTGLFEDSSVATKQHSLRQELTELSKHEKVLDKLIQESSLQLKHLTEDETNQRLAYVTYQDIRAISNFNEQTVIVVRAPPETRLEVPEVCEENVQLHLRSTNGPIEVYLCPEEILEESPAKESCFPLPTHQEVTKPTTVKVELVKTEVPSCLMEGEDGLLEPPQHLLQQTEDQLPSTAYGDPGPFVSFSPPLDQEDYLWGLEEGEGVSDLFDAYDLADLLKN
ncbi:transcription factor E2F2 [Notechis scutatus]|uniref:Transcription factor E2F2 n=1 Tax=Notechis scutatus TaxID=8663 RepID=A0A6J1UTQ6_9SAUR|nr:transcription factor E2F2 [Notechis scutatus]